MRGNQEFCRRMLAFGLAGTMAVGLGISAYAADMPGGDQNGGSGQSSGFTLSSAKTELESRTYTNVIFEDSTTADEVAVRAGDGVSAELTGVTIQKSGGDSSGDDTSFYGINSGLLVYGTSSAANVSLTDSTVTTGASGANGIFSYGEGVVSVSDSVVTTASSSSGGIMVAGGGTLYALNLQVTTEGGSSAAVRSDRGSGTMVVDQGIYVSNGSVGTGSPAIYCVADITAANATLVAKNAQAVCFEGRNPAWIYNCWLEGCYQASDDDENSNVMIYQSQSGDSDDGTSSFTMVGGVLKANNTSSSGNAKMFYTTNTYCYINLYDVEMQYADGMDTFLLCACNTNSRGWGTAGANGSECVLYCADQDISGDIIYDTYSLLYCYFTHGSVAETALVCREDNGSRGASVYMDADSEWIVTGDSTVVDLYSGGGTIADENGNTVSIIDTSGNNYVSGTSDYTITVTGIYSEEDQSAYDLVPTIGTEKPDFVYDYEELGIDTTVYTPVGEDDYTYITGKSVSISSLASVFADDDADKDDNSEEDSDIGNDAWEDSDGGNDAGEDSGSGNDDSSAADDGDDASTGDETAESGKDTLVTRRGNIYYFKYTLEGGNADLTIAYGRADDEVYAGDWDGDGVDTLCVRRGNTYYFSDSLKSGAADYVISYGRASDEVLVGDWDGDGVDTLCVRRGNSYYFSNTIRNGNADFVIDYGRTTDSVLVGKWSGNASGTAAVMDTLCVRRGNVYYISNSLTSGNADRQIDYGRSSDEVLAGDWNADGNDTLMVRRGNIYYISNSLTSGNADQVIIYGRSTDDVYAGTWQN